MMLTHLPLFNTDWHAGHRDDPALRIVEVRGSTALVGV